MLHTFNYLHLYSTPWVDQQATTLQFDIHLKGGVGEATYIRSLLHSESCVAGECALGVGGAHLVEQPRRLHTIHSEVPVQPTGGHL